MSDVAKSFASLVKNNNGLFKSDAQAKFLLSQCQEKNVYMTMSSVYRNSYTLFYRCDSRGVVSVEKYLPGKGTHEAVWERSGEGKETVQDTKEIKRIQREIKSLEKAIANRQAAWQRGEYGQHDVNLYHNAMKNDQEQLVAYKVRLEKMARG